MEAPRSLVLMGDIDQAPRLIEGLDSDRKEVRFMCHEALKAATGHDFGYDHLGPDQSALQTAVLRWRQWWGSYSGDLAFAQHYMQAHGLDAAAMPIVKDSSANKCGVICSSMEIAASMVLSNDEFLALKDEYVTQVRLLLTT